MVFRSSTAEQDPLRLLSVGSISVKGEYTYKTIQNNIMKTVSSLFSIHFNFFIQCSRKIWRGIKFGGLGGIALLLKLQFSFDVVLITTGML